MKRKQSYLYIVALIVTGFFSCEKNAIQTIDKPVTDGAQMKFFNFGIGAPSLNYFANDIKLSGTLSINGVVSPSGVSFGNVYPSSNYQRINAGTYEFKGIIPSTSTTNANKVVSTANKAVENNKRYSYYTCGLYNTNTLTTDAFVLEDILPAGDTSAAYIRFVNSVYNAQPLDLIIKNTSTSIETKAASAIAFKTGSVFIKVPYGVYDMSVRNSNATANLFTRTAVGLGQNRVYTLTVRGDITVTGSTAATRPQLDFTANR